MFVRSLPRVFFNDCLKVIVLVNTIIHYNFDSLCFFRTLYYVLSGVTVHLGR